MSDNQNYDVIVIGGGAAGFFTAINCKSLIPKAKVLIVEKSNKVLSKVRVSGGGRCNVTHACFENDLLVQNYPRGKKLLQTIFRKFSAQDTVDWFNKRGVKLITEEDGRMFPESNRSETIINCFLSEATRLEIEIMLQYEVCRIEKEGNIYSIEDGARRKLNCDYLIITSGGSNKKTSYQIIKKLSHTIEPPVPSLFTFNVEDKSLHALMGVSVPQTRVKIAASKLISEGPLLITHWGLSGPAILKLSAWGARELHQKDYSFTALINWLPEYYFESLQEKLELVRQQSPAKMIDASPFSTLPKRLWQYLIHKALISEGTRWADISKKQLNALINTLLNMEVIVKGKTTFKEEFVTCGGVVVKEIDFDTLESKLCPGLYFAGEVLDVDGITGGFNFQNAWSTAYIAATSVAKKLSHS